MKKNRFVILWLAGVCLAGLVFAGQQIKAKKDQAQKDKPQDRAKQVKKEDSFSSYFKGEWPSVILGRPTDDSVAINILSDVTIDGWIEYGTVSRQYPFKANPCRIESGKPAELEIKNLKTDTLYYYRLCYRENGQSDIKTTAEHAFHTRRAVGKAFTFSVQGDSHPERPQQNDPQLYIRTLANSASAKPDFFIALGDDFSVDTLQTVNAQTVLLRYLIQRPYLGLVGCCAPVFLVNGNHEQAALCNLDGSANNVAVLAQTVRNQYYPQPAPDGFYSGDTQVVEHIGLLRDYYAWTWGDALFVVIDPYWHSKDAVDNVFGGGAKRTDMWSITLGDAQYQWLKKTLEEGGSKFKFVFAHHVLGTGRGGIELVSLYEWGGQNKKGIDEFSRMRPGWEMPIHQLMAKTNVTIFFQGHDHLFVRQERDGVIYQTVPEPGDSTYTLYNDDAYKTGVKYPNSGYLRVAVSPAEVKVDYIRSWLDKDENAKQKNGKTAYGYTISAK